MAAWSGWEASVLSAIGAPVTAANVSFLDTWQQREGGGAAYNPLNTTQTAGGSWNYNSLGGGIGVQNFQDAASGAAATAQTLSGYPSIVAGLQSGNPWASMGSMASDFKTWSGGGYSSLTAPSGTAVGGSSGSSAPATAGSATIAGPTINFTSQGLTMAVVVIALILFLTGLGQFAGSSKAAA